MRVTKDEFIKICMENDDLLEFLRDNKCENSFFHNIIKAPYDRYPSTNEVPSLISQAFSWDQTIEGDAYWRELFEKSSLMYL